MRKWVKTLLILAAVCGAIFAIVYSAIKGYHDKNTWAVLRITIEGAEIEEDYARGEILDIPFAQVAVDKVKHGDGVILSSEADLEYNGQVLHQLTLSAGEQCQVRAGNQTAIIKMVKIWLM